MRVELHHEDKAQWVYVSANDACKTPEAIDKLIAALRASRRWLAEARKPKEIEQ